MPKTPTSLRVLLGLLYLPVTVVVVIVVIVIVIVVIVVNKLVTYFVLMCDYWHLFIVFMYRR